ncbi:MAG: bifunctional precorrin-2 dehydrogenase/sirohydrochlorin ferrochelatase [Desulfuromonadales bacterium]|nr:bifunctional precorrin-2 dehydrogenase/sirohydrochlorin ferrochelatase [Desulfuromonadales bacterium]MDW7757883.1 bifunctional precorrin-2 dehydrogenase/sirohydrochlorin ferrochelatase [Desulfuromonadales bacterium]
MPDFPVLLQLAGRYCVVVGGGSVALRKGEALIQAGARVRLIAPEIQADKPLSQSVEWVCRSYLKGDLKGAYLAIAATDNRRVNTEILEEARSCGVLINVADAPEDGDFTMPAVVRRGDLTLCAATNGRSPALAAVVRQHLDESFGQEWGLLLEIAAALRGKRLTAAGQDKYSQEVLRQLIEEGLPALLAAGATEAVDRRLEAVLGRGFSLAELGITLPKGMP